MIYLRREGRSKVIQLYRIHLHRLGAGLVSFGESARQGKESVVVVSGQGSSKGAMMVVADFHTWDLMPEKRYGLKKMNTAKMRQKRNSPLFQCIPHCGSISRTTARYHS